MQAHAQDDFHVHRQQRQRRLEMRAGRYNAAHALGLGKPAVGAGWMGGSQSARLAHLCRVVQAVHNGVVGEAQGAHPAVAGWGVA